MKVLPILGQHMAMSENMWVYSMPYKKLFPLCWCSLGLIKENALSLATNLWTVPLKLRLTFLVVSVSGLILCITKFIDKCKWCCSYTDTIHNLCLMLRTD